MSVFALDASSRRACSSHSVENGTTSGTVNVPIWLQTGANRSHTWLAWADNVAGFCTAPAGGSGRRTGGRFPAGTPRNDRTTLWSRRRPEFGPPISTFQLSDRSRALTFGAFLHGETALTELHTVAPSRV